ncbi:MAG: DUF2238 domain-containing protein [Sphingobacteriaceae bacterium]|nr:DUF2238 domain-containing protein [Sphingobacteriaceae bacterium]
MISTASSIERVPFKVNRLLQVSITLFIVFWLSTLIGTTNLANWMIENTLTFLFLIGLFVSYKKFKFSDLSYLIITLYLFLHVYGAKYTYAENPFGYWLKETFHLERNHYDRIVHFSFGFLLAYPMREYFQNHFQWPSWVCWILPCEITLSFSGAYEVIEWAVADLFFPEEGIAYLGTQGDIWDAQKDMGLAWLGSILIMGFVYLLKKILGKKKSL